MSLSKPYEKILARCSVSIRTTYLSPATVIKEIDIVDLGTLVSRLVEDIYNGVECDEDMPIVVKG
jgi:hypothetical protein